MITKGYIYGLRLRDSSEYRYVGLTTTLPEVRLGRHIYDAKRPDRKRRPVHDWINKYPSLIVVDTLEILENTNSFELGESESYWISQINGFGHRLLNLSLGGESGSYGARWKLKPDQIRNGPNSPMYGKTHSENSKLLNSEKHLGKVMSPESRAKMSKSRSGEKHWAYGGGKFSEEHRSKISESLKGKKPTEEALKNMKKAGELRRGRPFSDEHRRKLSEASKGKTGRPAWNKGLPNPTAHKRWHTNKGVSKPETCNFCKDESETK